MASLWIHMISATRLALLCAGVCLGSTGIREIFRLTAQNGICISPFSKQSCLFGRLLLDSPALVNMRFASPSLKTHYEIDGNGTLKIQHTKTALFGTTAENDPFHEILLVFWPSPLGELTRTLNNPANFDMILKSNSTEPGHDVHFLALLLVACVYRDNIGLAYKSISRSTACAYPVPEKKPGASDCILLEVRSRKETESEKRAVTANLLLKDDSKDASAALMVNRLVRALQLLLTGRRAYGKWYLDPDLLLQAYIVDYLTVSNPVGLEPLYRAYQNIIGTLGLDPGVGVVLHDEEEVNEEEKIPRTSMVGTLLSSIDNVCSNKDIFPYTLMERPGEGMQQRLYSRVTGKFYNETSGNCVECLAYHLMNILGFDLVTEKYVPMKFVLEHGGDVKDIRYETFSGFLRGNDELIGNYNSSVMNKFHTLVADRSIGSCLGDASCSVPFTESLKTIYYNKKVASDKSMHGALNEVIPGFSNLFCLLYDITGKTGMAAATLAPLAGIMNRTLAGSGFLDITVDEEYRYLHKNLHSNLNDADAEAAREIFEKALTEIFRLNDGVTLRVEIKELFLGILESDTPRTRTSRCPIFPKYISIHGDLTVTLSLNGSDVLMFDMHSRQQHMALRNIRRPMVEDFNIESIECIKQMRAGGVDWIYQNELLLVPYYLQAVFDRYTSTGNNHTTAYHGILSDNRMLKGSSDLLDRVFGTMFQNDVANSAELNSLFDFSTSTISRAFNRGEKLLEVRMNRERLKDRETLKNMIVNITLFQISRSLPINSLSDCIRPFMSENELRFLYRIRIPEWMKNVEKVLMVIDRNAVDWIHKYDEEHFPKFMDMWEEIKKNAVVALMDVKKSNVAPELSLELREYLDGLSGRLTQEEIAASKKKEKTIGLSQDHLKNVVTGFMKSIGAKLGITAYDLSSDRCANSDTYFFPYVTSIIWSTKFLEKSMTFEISRLMAQYRPKDPAQDASLSSAASSSNPVTTTQPDAQVSSEHLKCAVRRLNVFSALYQRLVQICAFYYNQEDDIILVNVYPNVFPVGFSTKEEVMGFHKLLFIHNIVLDGMISRDLTKFLPPAGSLLSNPEYDTKLESEHLGYVLNMIAFMIIRYTQLKAAERPKDSRPSKGEKAAQDTSRHKSEIETLREYMTKDLMPILDIKAISRLIVTDFFVKDEILCLMSNIKDNFVVPSSINMELISSEKKLDLIVGYLNATSVTIKNGRQCIPLKDLRALDGLGLLCNTKEFRDYLNVTRLEPSDNEKEDWTLDELTNAKTVLEAIRSGRTDGTHELDDAAKNLLMIVDGCIYIEGQQ